MGLFGEEDNPMETFMKFSLALVFAFLFFGIAAIIIPQDHDYYLTLIQIAAGIGIIFSLLPYHYFKLDFEDEKN